MFEVHTARRDIERRNQIRAEARLPPLSVSAELRRLHEAERQRQFEEFFVTSPLRGTVEQRLLARARRVRRDADWMPTGSLSGGGLWFYSRTRSVMHRLWRIGRKRLAKANAREDSTPVAAASR